MSTRLSNLNEEKYYAKYLKYKAKYLNLRRSLQGGTPGNSNFFSKGMNYIIYDKK